MINPAQIKQKALRLWQNQTYLKAWMEEQELHPIEIPFTKVRGKALTDNFSRIQAWLQELSNQSKNKRGYGYVVDYQTIAHRQLGQQSLPSRICIPTREDYLRLIGKQKEFLSFTQLTHMSLTRWPKLRDYFKRKPLSVIENAENWHRILKVCDYFSEHPRPNLYLRQLDIPDVDSKFIENNLNLISDLLTLILPQEHWNPGVTGMAQHAFERRFGLKYDMPLIRFRLLDPGHSLQGLRDITLPIDEFQRWVPAANNIFITENKINGLSFPDRRNAMIIFGLGYGVEAVSKIPWLKDKAVYYWGDIDTHGFSILDRLRKTLPQTVSLLMNKETLKHCRYLWVEESKEKRYMGALYNLTEQEQALYQDLLHNHFGPNVRLEQERIPFSLLTPTLHKL